MSIGTMIVETIGFFSDAVGVVFSADLEKHPSVGIQPFTGEINRDRRTH
jgi:hypothetical protein